MRATSQLFFPLSLLVMLIACKKPSADTPLELRDGTYTTGSNVKYELPVLYTVAGAVSDTALIRTFLSRHNGIYTSLPPADSLFYFGSGTRTWSDTLQLSIAGNTVNGSVPARYLEGSLGERAGNASFSGSAVRFDGDYLAAQWSELSSELLIGNDASGQLLHSLPHFQHQHECGSWPDQYKGFYNYCKSGARFPFTNMGDSLSADFYRALVLTDRAIPGSPGQRLMMLGYTRTLAGYVGPDLNMLLQERDTLLIQRSWVNLRRR